jgi:hypothetical protein
MNPTAESLPVGVLGYLRQVMDTVILQVSDEVQEPESYLLVVGSRLSWRLSIKTSLVRIGKLLLHFTDFIFDANPFSRH